MTDFKYDNVKKTISLVTADVEDACLQHGIRGHLEHRDIERMIANYTLDELEARVHGRFQHLIGRVFKKFDRKIHVIKPFQINEQDYTVYQAYDPHPQLPDAVMWLAVDKNGTMFVCDELFENGITEEQVQWVKKKDELKRIVARVMDPLGFNKDQHEKLGRSLQEIMNEDYGLYYDKASKARSTGIKLIENAINYQEKDGKVIVPPRLYVFETCTETIKEFEYISWAVRKGRTADEHDPTQKTVDKDDHFVPENLGRILMLDPKWEEPEEEEKEEVFETELDQGY